MIDMLDDLTRGRRGLDPAFLQSTQIAHIPTYLFTIMPSIPRSDTSSGAEGQVKMPKDR